MVDYLASHTMFKRIYGYSLVSGKNPDGFIKFNNSK